MSLMRQKWHFKVVRLHVLYCTSLYKHSEAWWEQHLAVGMLLRSRSWKACQARWNSAPYWGIDLIQSAIELFVFQQELKD